MEILVSVEGVGDRSIEAAAPAIVGDLVAGLGLGHELTLLVHRTGRVLDRSETVAGAGLRSGDTVEPVPVGSSPRPEQDEPPATLRVLSGPEEGRSFDLAYGDTSIGRVASNDVVLFDVSLSRRHAVVSVDDEGIIISDAGSTNGVLVDGRVIEEETKLGPDQPVLVGQTWFVVDHHAGQAWPDDTPVIRYEPTAKADREFEQHSVTLPVPPAGDVDPEASEGPSAEPGLAAEHFETSLRTVTARLEGLVDADRLARLFDAPSVAEVHRSIKQRARLWERFEHDHLTLRLGRTSMPSRLEIVVPDGGTDEQRLRLEEIRDRYETVDDAPATLDLDVVGGLEVCGPLAISAELVAEMLGQLAALHSHRHLVLTAILAETARSFEFLKWLPHTRPQALTPAVTPPDAEALASGLLDRVSADLRPDDRVVVAVEADALPPADLADLMHRGPAAGVHVIAMVRPGAPPTTNGHRPAPARVTVDDSGRLATVTVLGRVGGEGAGTDDLGIDTEIVLERSDGRLLRELARRLAPVVDARYESDDDETVEPDSALVGADEEPMPPGPHPAAMLGLPDAGFNPQVVLGRWQKAGETLGAPLGHSDDGPIVLDLAQDTLTSIFAGGFGLPEPGPDDRPRRAAATMVEQALISMAATYPPEHLNLVLIDGSAGPTFQQVVGLPHTVATVTDLSETGVQRALTSLKVEYQRRVASLAKDDDPGLDGRRRRLAQGMPDLLIVVDELAEANSSAPDFMTHLVDLVHRGLEVGFRLLASSDRLDRLGPETLAKFPTRVVLGDNAVLQRDGVSQRSFRPLAAMAEEVDRAPTVIVRSLDLGPGRDLARVVGGDGQRETIPPMSTPALIDTIRSADGLRPDASELRKPILPPLPTLVDLRKLPKPSDDSQFVVGIVDLPERQRRIVMAFNAARDRSLSVIGPPGTGKSSALRSVAASVGLTQVVADRLPLIYAIDFDGGDLAPLASLPHVATVADELPRMLQVLADLEHLYLGRRNSFDAVGASTLAEYRDLQQDDLVRQVLVLIDGFGEFCRQLQTADERWLDLVYHILTDGSRVGLHFVLTAPTADEVPPEMAAQVGRWMSLIGTPGPGGPPLGRALVSDNEVQLARLDAAADPQAEAEALGRLTEELLARGATPSPAV